MDKLIVTEKTPDKGAVLRTPVREKAWIINFRRKESPENFPDKQYRISQFFGKKSPKAERSRETLGMKKETEAKPINTSKGATCSPLLEDSGQPGSQEIPSRAPGPGVEVCGRP